MTFPFRSLTGAVLLAGAALVAGCSGGGDAPTRPEAPQAAVGPREGPRFVAGTNHGLEEIARFNRRPQITVAWAKMWVGPEGGRVDFHGFAIEVPRGAVTKRTMFTLRVPVDPYGGEHAVAEFGPHNQTFLRPIQIELPYRGTSAEGTSAEVLWFNEAAGAWESVGGSLTTDGQRVKTQVNHFSTYGTRDVSRGGQLVTAGG